MFSRAAILIVVLALTGCSKESVPADRTAIFPKENAKALLALCHHEPTGITGYWTPQSADLAGLEDHLQAYLGTRPERRRVPAIKPAWSQFYRQVAGIEIGGRRYLFVAYSWCFEMRSARYVAELKKESEAQGRRYDPEWWKKQPILVMDGGSGFFRIVYDPRTKQFTWYEQNGEG